jgi:hypothetical protein
MNLEGAGKMTQSRRMGARVLALAACVSAGSAISAAPASAAAKEIHLANGVTVSVAPGWIVGNKGADNVTLGHRSPPASFNVLATGPIQLPVTQAATLHMSQFAKGAGLKHLKTSAPQEINTSASSFDQAVQITFSGTTKGGTKLVGAAVEYQNSETGNGAFAAVLGTPAAKTVLKQPVNAMFNSVIADSGS